jgi:glycosyltransferase involved in cell wall biosynthesis
MNDKFGIIRIPPANKEKDASKDAIQNCVNLSENHFEEIVVFDRLEIESNNVTLEPVEKNNYKNIVLKAMSHLLFQIRLTKSIAKHRDKLDAILWHAGGFSLIIPLLYSKICRIENIVTVLGEPTKGFSNESYWGKWSLVLAKLSYMMESTSYYISDKILVLSPSQKKYHMLSGYSSKLYNLSFNYQDIPDDQTLITERDNNIVYLGRICKLKGADKFADSIEQFDESTINKIDGIKFIGDGDLKEELEGELSSTLKSEEIVEFTGWLSRNKVDEHLSKSSLFVLPSKSEGIPKALQESMAHGLIPVVSPVGGIPDIIQDGKNGIILEDNDPTTIEQGIKEALLQDQEKMSNKAKKTVKEEFSYESVCQEFEKLVQ